MFNFNQFNLSTLKGKIGIKIVLFLYHIYNKIILQARRNLYWWFYTKVSKQLLFKFKDKKIKFIHNVAHIITSKILTEGMDEKYNQFYEEQKALIDTELMLILSAAEYNKMIADYHLLTQFFYSVLETDTSKKKAEEELSKARKYDADAIALTTATFNKKRAEIKKRYDKEKKEYHSQLGEVQNEDFYKTLPKILPKLDITSAHIVSFVGIVSTVFLLTGFIYNKYFLGFYNIEVSKFFSIGDYLASSVDKIFLSVRSAFVGIIIYIIGMFSAVRRIVREYHYEQKTKRYDGIMYTFMIGWLILTVLYWYKDLPGKHHFLSLSIFIILMFLYQSIPLEKYLKKGAVMSISMVFFVLLTFSLSIYDNIMDERDKISHSDLKALKKYNFTFDGNIGFDESSTFLLSGNSEYFFFYDKKGNRSYIVPKSRVKSIESVK